MDDRRPTTEDWHGTERRTARGRSPLSGTLLAGGARTSRGATGPRKRLIPEATASAAAVGLVHKIDSTYGRRQKNPTPRTSRDRRGGRQPPPTQSSLARSIIRSTQVLCPWARASCSSPATLAQADVDARTQDVPPTMCVRELGSGRGPGVGRGVCVSARPHRWRQ